jgi:hypothetical protein
LVVHRSRHLIQLDRLVDALEPRLLSRLEDEAAGVALLHDGGGDEHLARHGLARIREARFTVLP